MKKIFLITLIMTAGIPANASCAISGSSCAYSGMAPPLQEKYLPNYVQDIQKPDAFRPQYIKPYYDELINTETGAAADSVQGGNNYNSNCQFGVCLPEVNPGAGASE